MWGNWFGGQTAQRRRDAPKKAILDLRQQLDMLQKRERHLETQMAQQDKIARDNVTSNKTGEFGTRLFGLGKKWGRGETGCRYIVNSISLQTQRSDKGSCMGQESDR